MKIAAPLQTKLWILTLFFAGISGCQQKQQPPSTIDKSSLHSHTSRKDTKIDVPVFVSGKWKAVRIAVIDKSNVSQKTYTIPIGNKFDVPASTIHIKVETFLPAFIMEGSTITSATNELTNPGVKVQITEKDTFIFKGWLFSKYPNTHAFMHPKYAFSLVDVIPANR